MTTYRHGENTLLPVSEVPKGGKVIFNGKADGFVFAHSESSHNHLIEADQLVVTEVNGELYLNLPTGGKAIHQKMVEAHKTLELTPNIYKVLRKTEYNPFKKLLEQVRD